MATRNEVARQELPRRCVWVPWSLPSTPATSSSSASRTPACPRSPSTASSPTTRGSPCRPAPFPPCSSPGYGQEPDDQLGGIAQRRVEQSSDSWPGLATQLTGRLPQRRRGDDSTAASTKVRARVPPRRLPTEPGPERPAVHKRGCTVSCIIASVGLSQIVDMTVVTFSRARIVGCSGGRCRFPGNEAAGCGTTSGRRPHGTLPIPRGGSDA